MRYLKESGNHAIDAQLAPLHTNVHNVFTRAALVYLFHAKHILG